MALVNLSPKTKPESALINVNFIESKNYFLYETNNLKEYIHT